MKTICYIADERELLNETLETEKPIPYETLILLIKSGLYKFYAYDKRIKAYRYLIINMEQNYNLPNWLHYYGLEKPL